MKRKMFKSKKYSRGKIFTYGVKGETYAGKVI